MSLQPTPQDPLDSFVYPWSYNWTKSYKPSNLGSIGKPLDKLTIEGKGKLLLRLKPDAKLFDIVEHRRNLRTRILNAKARKLENKLDDVLAQNEIEAKYAKQQAELQKLENMFQSGILGGVLDNISNLARQQFQSEYFANDPDISSFDAETKRIMDLTKTIQRNTEQLDRSRVALSRQLQDIENDVRSEISISTTSEQLEAIAEFSAELEELRSQTGQLEPEVFDIEEDLISVEGLEQRVQQLEEQQQEVENRLQQADDLEENIPMVATTVTREETRQRIQNLISQGQNIVERLKEQYTSRGIVLPRNIQRDIDFFTSPREITRSDVVQRRIDRLTEFIEQRRSTAKTTKTTSVLESSSR